MISLLEESGFTELSAVHRGESGVTVLKAPTLLNKTQRNLSWCINSEITTLFPSVENEIIFLSQLNNYRWMFCSQCPFGKLNMGTI